MGATATDAWMGRRPRIGDAITRKTGEDFLSSSHGWRWNMELATWKVKLFLSFFYPNDNNNKVSGQTGLEEERVESGNR